MQNSYRVSSCGWKFGSVLAWYAFKIVFVSISLRLATPLETADI